MSKEVHAAHVAHRFLESTKVGHQITAGTIATTVGIAKVVGLGSVAATVAPIIVPFGLIVGPAILAKKVMGKGH